MRSALLDTIVAPITGTGAAAVAIVRISGPTAQEIASHLFAPWPASIEPRHLYYGRFRQGDDGLMAFFPEGKSYTGEEIVECHIHGSPASVRALIDHCVELGARLAEPGEFTYRAFMNGRLDLTEAEGVRETIESQTRSQLRQANLLREGVLKRRVSEVRDDVFKVLAEVEATVDFSEELGDLNVSEALLKIDGIVHQLDHLIASEDSSRLVRDGFTVAIVGQPNAGKSSLLNAVLRADRAIVTPIPGTTRDTIEEWADVRGVKVRLIDTAGLRESSETVEAMGILRAREAAENADAVWYVYDASLGWGNADKAECARLPTNVEILANKADLLDGAPSRGRAISAKTGAGLAELLDDLTRAWTESEIGIGINERHGPLLRGAREALELARKSLGDEVPVDLSAVHLRDAIYILGQVTGETATEDMVARIFQDFCVGK